VKTEHQPDSARSTFRCYALLLAAFVFTMALDAASLKSILAIPGSTLDSTPLSGRGNRPTFNRLGGFASDLYYDRSAKVFYGLADRGPGGGNISYDTRVHKFALDIDPVTGEANNFRLLDTIRFKIPASKMLNGVRGPATLNGIDPLFEPSNRGPRNVGRSFDPEGFVVAPNGHFYVSDEYAPSVYEFLPDGTFVRAFTPPSNVVPRDAEGVIFTGFGSHALTQGRPVNRGYEGLAINPAGSQLFAMLQSPLSDEGSNEGCTIECLPAGRFSRNVRIVVYSTATGRSIAQYIYQLDPLSSINARIASDPYGPNSQGSKIGISALATINDHEFLVLERDDRGVGINDPTGSRPISLKRIYRIDIAGATDVSRISLAGTNILPSHVVPVKKGLFLDLVSELRAAGGTIPEKLEGLAIGPQLADGTYEILIGSDNDFSVTQNGSGTQFDICTNGSISQRVAIDAGCPAGLSLLPTYLLSFKTAAKDITLPMQRKR
jgi:hypothetical protein